MTPQTSTDEFVLSTVALVCNFERDQVTPRTLLADIGMDSLNITAFVAQLESTYDSAVTADDVLGLLQAPSIADLAALVSVIVSRPKTMVPAPGP